MNDSDLDVMTFSLEGKLYGVEVTCISEALWLPALYLLEEQPAYIIGAFDLRGELVRVLDLNIRFGHPPTLISKVSIVVVTHTNQGLIGLIASELGITGRARKIIGKSTSVEGSNYRPLVLAQFQLEHNTGTLLDSEELLVGDTFPFEYLIEHRDPLALLSESDREILNKRKANYRQLSVQASSEDAYTIAIVTINGDRFGLDVSIIQEFSYANQIYPLPGLPPFVAGNMNLRGEIITVFDITILLGLDPVRISSNTCLTIFKYEQLTIGMLVDELVDVVDVHAEELNQAPVSISDKQRKLLLGEYRYQSSSVVVLDVEKIFSAEHLIVDQG